MYRWFLAIRYLMTRPINLLGLIGIALGVWALIVVVSIFTGYIREVTKHLQSRTADLTALQFSRDAEFDQIRAVLEEEPNVAAVAPRLIWQGLIHPFGETPTSAAPAIAVEQFAVETPFVSILGVDPAYERRATGMADWLVAESIPAEVRVRDPADPLAAIDGKPVVLLSRSRMEREGVQVGDPAKISIGRFEFADGAQVLIARDAEFVVGGAFESSYAAFDAMNVFVAIEALRELLGTKDAIVNEVAIALHDASSADETAERLQRALRVELSQGMYGPEVWSWERANKLQLESYDHQTTLMKLVLLVLIVVAVFLVFATLWMMVTEKTRDIGILTAMGAGPDGVSLVFLVCGLVISVVGITLGVTTGCLTAIWLDPINTFVRDTFGIDLFPLRVYKLRYVPHELDPWWIVKVSVYALVLGAVAAVLPALRASLRDPLVSLRHE